MRVKLETLVFLIFFHSFNLKSLKNFHNKICHITPECCMKLKRVTLYLNVKVWQKQGYPENSLNHIEKKSEKHLSWDASMTWRHILVTDKSWINWFSFRNFQWRHRVSKFLQLSPRQLSDAMFTQSNKESKSYSKTYD